MFTLLTYRVLRAPSGPRTLHRALAIAAHAGTGVYRAVQLSASGRVAGRLDRAGRTTPEQTLRAPRPGGLHYVPYRTRAQGPDGHAVGLDRQHPPGRDRGRRVRSRVSPAGPAAPGAGVTMAQPVGDETRRTPWAGDQRAGPGTVADDRHADLADRPVGRSPARSRTSGRSAGSRSSPSPPQPTPGAVLLLNGTGGGSLAGAADQALAPPPAWDWAHLGGSGGTWADNPWPVLQNYG